MIINSEAEIRKDAKEMRKRFFSGLIVLVLVGMAAAATACGGAKSEAMSAQASPGKQAPAAAPANPSGSSTSPSSVSQSAPATQQDQLTKGEVIFQKTAGGVGCQYCHGADAKGKIGPNIRGKKPGDIQFALQSVEAMQIVRLNEEEINAVSAYLGYLATQP